ncbi:MAG: hypothetical protein CSA20_09870 [Deltaproteobacteria bacterium]|nr:MAG: hypothetical protein CSA20_09870 [Deltaproteobacteria bacterium]
MPAYKASFTAKESKLLSKLLKLAPVPEYTFTIDELAGYLFGLAMTPDIILPSESIPPIFGYEMPEYNTMEEMETLNNSLFDTLNRFIRLYHDGELVFPFALQDMGEEDLERLYLWTSGFEEALSLRDELWEPDEYPNLSDARKQELFHSLMTINGLVDPMAAIDFFDNIPKKAFTEMLPHMDPDETSREALIQMFLLSSLPISVETLVDHSRMVEMKRQNQLHNQARQKTGKGGKKKNVIKVDFTRSGK